MLANGPHTGLRVDPERLERTLRSVAAIGADPGGGVSRLGLGPAERQARLYLAEVAAAAGLVSEVDPAANLLVRRRMSTVPGSRVLLFGSHVDSVRQGGWLDGAYGVVAAIEVLSVLAEHDVPCPAEPVAIGFSNEEGALVQYPFWGSRALAGSLVDLDRACDRDGNAVDGYLAQSGGDPNRLAEAVWRPGELAGFLELHIEQGTVLERAGVPIGVVDGIVGRSIFDIRVVGGQGHPGTTPMADRRDALAAAARLVLDVEAIAGERGLCARSTTGYLRVHPNTTNTIPGMVELTAEVRDVDPVRLDGAEAEVLAVAARLARERGVEVNAVRAARSEPVHTDPALRAAVTAAARTVGVASTPISSGAGHDAQIVADIAPVGMIFVPSRDGISHQPDEDTAIADLCVGADVLLQTVLAAQPSG